MRVAVLSKANISAKWRICVRPTARSAFASMGPPRCPRSVAFRWEASLNTGRLAGTNLAGALVAPVSRPAVVGTSTSAQNGSRGVQLLPMKELPPKAPASRQDTAKRCQEPLDRNSFAGLASVHLNIVQLRCVYLVVQYSCHPEQREGPAVFVRAQEEAGPRCFQCFQP